MIQTAGNTTASASRIALDLLRELGDALGGHAAGCAARRGTPRSAGARTARRSARAIVSPRSTSSASATSNTSSANAQAQPRSSPRPRASDSPSEQRRHARARAANARRGRRRRWRPRRARRPAPSRATLAALPWRSRCSASGRGETSETGAKRRHDGRAAEQERRRGLRPRDAAQPVLRSRSGPGRHRSPLAIAPAAWRASVRRVRQQGDVPGALDRLGQLALVLRAGAEHAPGQDLAALGHELRDRA